MSNMLSRGLVSVAVSLSAPAVLAQESGVGRENPREEAPERAPRVETPTKNDQGDDFNLREERRKGERELKMFLDTPLDDEVIVWDPLLIGSRTSNGAMFGYRMHYNPDNISLVALHIRAGSMDELPGESGAAALVHRLALDHTVNLPDGSAVEFLTSRGWSEEDPGFVSPSETVYNFFLFEPTQEEIDRLYTLMGDIAGHLEFREADFLREREALARELDAREADGSLGRYDWIVAGAKGTELGEHPPMGLSPEAVRSLTLEDVQRFYERTYTPKRISTVGYGKGLPNRHLLKFDARVNVLGPVVDASRSDRGVLGDLPLRVTVLRDSAAERAQFNVVTFTEQHPVPAYFGEMIPHGEDRQVATTMTERMRRLIEAGELSAEIAAMRIEGLGTEVRTVRVVAEGEPAGWRDLVFDVASALGQAREGGFLTDEYGTALRVGTLDIGDAAAAHGKVHPRESIGWQIDRLDEGRVISALGQETIHMQGGAFETTIERVNERFNEVIDPEGSGLVLVLPAGAELPSETDVRDAFLAGLEDAERTGLRTEALLPNPPERGAVVEITEDAESGVWSAWLSNGVRVHYRYMPNSQDLVTTRIVLAGGQIEEDAGNRGITDGALSSWIQPETDELDNRQFLTLLSGHRVRFLPNRSVDALYLDMFSDDEDLGIGLTAAYALLTRPSIEADLFQNWKRQARTSVRRTGLDSLGALYDAWPKAVFGEAAPWMLPLSAEDIERLTLEDSERWLERITSTAPMEVAIVGDVDREEVFDLAERFLAGLPARERISPEFLMERRSLPPLTTDVALSDEMVSVNPNSYALHGFIGADATEYVDSRVLETIAAVLPELVIYPTLAQGASPSEVGIYNFEGGVIPGYGMFAGVATVPEHNVEESQQIVRDAFERFSRGEFDRERCRQLLAFIAGEIQGIIENPQSIAPQVAELTYKSRDPATVFRVGELMAQQTPESIVEVFNKYYRGSPTVDVAIKRVLPGQVQERDAGPVGPAPGGGG